MVETRINFVEEGLVEPSGCRFKFWHFFLIISTILLIGKLISVAHAPPQEIITPAVNKTSDTIQQMADGVSKALITHKAHSAERREQIRAMFDRLQ